MFDLLRCARWFRSGVSLDLAVVAWFAVQFVPALAADAGAAGEKQSKPEFVDWSGPYFGVNGSAGGLFRKYMFAPILWEDRVIPGFTTGYGGARRATSFVAGAHAGYNWQLGRLMLGAEADVAVISVKQAVGNEAVPAFGLADADSTFDLFRIKADRVASVRARAGVSFDRFLVFATGGPILSDARVMSTLPSGVGSTVERTQTRTLVGITAGAGFEVVVAPNLALGAEYRFSQFAQAGYELSVLPSSMPASARVAATSHQVTARLTWFPNGLRDPVDEDDKEAREGGGAERKDWSVHAQSTFIQQGVPGFHSLYVGANSLLPNQARQTWTNTAFLGIRLWEGGEAYFNPEFTQGFGPSGTLGLAGFSNGESAKAGFTYPKFRPQRYFVRQTFGFGGEQEPVKDGPNQIAGTRDIDRLTISAGKFSVVDVFDDNAFAHDPRTNFMNGALFTSLAYDYPANLAGYTNGVVADLNRKDWAVRAGLFQVPKAASSDILDTRPGRGGAVAEFEARYSVLSEPGKLRVGTFLNRTFSGSYQQAFLAADVNDGLVRSRRGRNKAGFYLNAEQGLTDDLGLFARLSWNNARTEIVSYTDVDMSASGGVSIKGSAWGRPKDVVGIGGAINALTPVHREFLAAGGIGLLIGDGRLRYSPEKIFESYYSLSLHKAVTLTFDYQRIGSPGYNADRGPASFLSARLHVEY